MEWTPIRKLPSEKECFIQWLLLANIIFPTAENEISQWAAETKI
jgi:hypothetical protein